MSDPVPPTRDPLETALSDALPQLRSLRLQGLAGLAALLAATVFLGIILLNAGKDAQSWAIIVGFAGVFGMIALAGWVKKSHEAAIMPILAATLNLSHQKSAKHFITQIPQNFIPRGGKQTCDDLMSGQIAGRPFCFAEVKTETGGKNSSTLFDGVVVEGASGSSKAMSTSRTRRAGTVRRAARVRNTDSGRRRSNRQSAK